MDYKSIYPELAWEDLTEEDLRGCKLKHYIGGTIYGKTSFPRVYIRVISQNTGYDKVTVYAERGWAGLVPYRAQALIKSQEELKTLLEITLFRDPQHARR